MTKKWLSFFKHILKNPPDIPYIRSRHEVLSKEKKILLKEMNEVFVEKHLPSLITTLSTVISILSLIIALISFGFTIYYNKQKSNNETCVKTIK